MVFTAAEVAHSCKSAKDNDRQAEWFLSLLKDGGARELELESPLVLGLDSALHIAIAKANVLWLVVIVLFEDLDIPPLQILRLEASMFLRFLV